MNSILTLGALVLYAVDSIWNLAGCWCGNKKLRTATKPLLMPLVLLYYLSFGPSIINPYLIGAIVACWLGDVLLMKHGDHWFAAGGIAFMLAHVLFILVYVHQTKLYTFSSPTSLLVLVLYFGAIVIVARIIHENAKGAMWNSVLFYLLCNATMNFFALVQMIFKKGNGTVIAYIGAVLFFVSDCLLFVAKFGKQRSNLIKSYCLVMLTYILGVLLITMGMIMVYRHDI